MRMIVRMDFENGGYNISNNYCRGYLLRNVRAVLIRNLSKVVGYKLINTQTKRTAPVLGTINRIVKHVCPHLPAPILGAEDFEKLEVMYKRGCGPFVGFDIDPRFLQYGWAINALLIGYLRQHVWKLQTGAHKADIKDLRLRLKHWWENDWATDPAVTWFFRGCVDDQHAALASVFSFRRERYGELMVPRMKYALGECHEVVQFGYRMIELGLSKKAY